MCPWGVAAVTTAGPSSSAWSTGASRLRRGAGVDIMMMRAVDVGVQHPLHHHCAGLPDGDSTNQILGLIIII